MLPGAVRTERRLFTEPAAECVCRARLGPCDRAQRLPVGRVELLRRRERAQHPDQERRHLVASGPERRHGALDTHLEVGVRVGPDGQRREARGDVALEPAAGERGSRDDVAGVRGSSRGLGALFEPREQHVFGRGRRVVREQHGPAHGGRVLAVERARERLARTPAPAPRRAAGQRRDAFLERDRRAAVPAVEQLPLGRARAQPVVDDGARAGAREQEQGTEPRDHRARVAPGARAVTASQLAGSNARTPASSEIHRRPWGASALGASQARYSHSPRRTTVYASGSFSRPTRWTR